MKTCKLLILLYTLLYAIGPIRAQTDESGKGEFERVKLLARQQNKLIFVDLYFEGCMPCKAMEDNVFPHPEVASLLKEHFIFYKTDVFKEPDGKKLARKYAAVGYPTYLALTPEGKAISIAFGYYSPDKFIPILNSVIQKNQRKQYLAFDTDLDKQYPTSYSYRYLKTGEKGDVAELKSFIEGKNLLDEVPFVVSLLVNTPDVNEAFYRHLPQLIELYGAETLSMKMEGIAKQKMKNLGERKELDSLHSALDYIRPVFTDRLWKAFLPSFLNGYYLGNRDAQTYLKLIEKYKTCPTWELRSNALGQLIVDHSKDSTLLKDIIGEYETEEEKGTLDFTDQYKLTLLYLYLKEYQKAKSGMELLWKADWKNPYHRLKQEDMEAFQRAIDEKKPALYVGRNMDKVLSSNLND